MRMNFDPSELFEADDDLVTDSDLVGYNRPSEIVHDPVLTVARKRQLLAHWGSDIHAVAGAPALRTYARGATVCIDDIQAALRDLDDMVDLAAIGSKAASGASA